MPLTDNRGWAIGRVEVRIPEIAEASSYCDFRSNISRMQQYSKSVIFDCPWAGGRGAIAALETRTLPRSGTRWLQRVCCRTARVLRPWFRRVIARAQHRPKLPAKRRCEYDGSGKSDVLRPGFNQRNVLLLQTGSLRQIALRQTGLDAGSSEISTENRGRTRILQAPSKLTTTITVGPTRMKVHELSL
jgi:hypothetical protein